MKTLKNVCKGVAAASMALVIMAAAAVFGFAGEAEEEQPLTGHHGLENVKTGETITSYDMQVGDTFSIGFVHSVNKSPVTDYYEIRDDGIYVVKTIYYGFGAGVQTELEEGQELTYGEDGSMIITGFDRRMDNLTYIVGTVSDHTLVLYPGEENEASISLRDLCGRHAMVHFSWEPDPAT